MFNRQVIINSTEGEPKFEDLGFKSILSAIFEHASPDTQQQILRSNKIICEKNDHDLITLLESSPRTVIEKQFGLEFMREIEVIKEMTSKQMKRIENTEEESIFTKYLAALHDSLVGQSEEEQSKTLSSEQKFFLGSECIETIYSIPPHSSLEIGPVYFRPDGFEEFSSVLFIKNNLSILYPVELVGRGGSGSLSFHKSENNKYCQKAYSEKARTFSIVIHNKSQIFSAGVKSFKDSFSVTNKGSLPLVISSLSLDNGRCSNKVLKIHNCGKHTLKPNENRTFHYTVKPNLSFFKLTTPVWFDSSIGKVAVNFELTIDPKLASEILQLENDEKYDRFGKYLCVALLLFLAVIFVGTSIELSSISKPAVEVNIHYNEKSIRQNPELLEANLIINNHRKINKQICNDFLRNFDGLEELQDSRLIRTKKSVQIHTVDKEQSDEEDSFFKIKKKPVKKVVKKDKPKTKPKKNIIGVGETEKQEKPDKKIEKPKTPEKEPSESKESIVEDFKKFDFSNLGRPSNEEKTKEDPDSSYFISDKEKPVEDSGTEDFISRREEIRFNFNDIFKSDTLKITEEYEAEKKEEDNDYYLTGSYFNTNSFGEEVKLNNQNFFFFEEPKSNMFAASNPFATDPGNGSMLGDLKGDESRLSGSDLLSDDEESFSSQKEKMVDDIVDIEDEEEDPEWADEVAF